jgi:hypothetical protein
LNIQKEEKRRKKKRRIKYHLSISKVKVTFSSMVETSGDHFVLLVVVFFVAVGLFLFDIPKRDVTPAFALMSKNINNIKYQLTS